MARRRPVRLPGLQDRQAGVDREKKLGSESVIAADGCLYCYGQSDRDVGLRRGQPDRDTWRRAGSRSRRNRRSGREQGGIWTHPVIADGKLYLRDQELLFCFDLRGRAGEREVKDRRT